MQEAMGSVIEALKVLVETGRDSAAILPLFHSLEALAHEMGEELDRVNRANDAAFDRIDGFENQLADLQARLAAEQAQLKEVQEREGRPTLGELLRDKLGEEEEKDNPPEQVCFDVGIRTDDSFWDSTHTDEFRRTAFARAIRDFNCWGYTDSQKFVEQKYQHYKEDGDQALMMIFFGRPLDNALHAARALEAEGFAPVLIPCL